MCSPMRSASAEGGLADDYMVEASGRELVKSIVYNHLVLPEPTISAMVIASGGAPPATWASPITWAHPLNLL